MEAAAVVVVNHWVVAMWTTPTLLVTLPTKQTHAQH